jgi:hypothetical protein
MLSFVPEKKTRTIKMSSVRGFAYKLHQPPVKFLRVIHIGTMTSLGYQKKFR